MFAAGRPRRNVEHRTQILLELQRAGIEPVQRHRLWNAVGSVAPTFIPPTSDRWNYWTGQTFGESTGLAGGIFASPSGSAARRIFFQAAFTF